MLVEPIVSYYDQSPIETIRRDAGFACADQQDCPPTRIEGIRDSPLTITHAEPQLLMFLCRDPFNVSA
jgi:hypothetical protein